MSRIVRRGVALLVVSFLTGACATHETPPADATLDGPAMAAAVRTELLHAWNGYERYAWGHDELRPLSKGGRDWHEGTTLLMTPVDALDTLILMGLGEEADKTREYVATNLHFDVGIEVQVFEITIRILGGLLSSYQLTGDPRLLALAEDLGERLLPAFDSPTGMPYRFVNLATGETRDAQSNPAEIGTLILEFGTLAKLTDRDVFYDKAKLALLELYRHRAPTDLVGEVINVETGGWSSTASHVGARIDSYYEYLLKCDRLFGDDDCAAMWRTSRAALDRYLADERPDGFWYGEADMQTGERVGTPWGALEAFLPGVLALDGDLDRARRLQESSLRMWRLHGIEPDGIDYSTMEILEPGYPLRPEIVESAYVLHELTGDPRYLVMGRSFFESLTRYCRTDAGYAVLESVLTKEQGDRMHSFFLAETLKYLYLLYAPEAIDFRQVVFNTEAHPLRRTW